MRGLMAAVGKVLAALAVMITVWCEELGKFVLRCLPGYQPADPGQVVEAYDAAADEKSVLPDFDHRVASIQSAAGLLLRQQPVPADLVKGLKPKTAQWLALLDTDMLATVANASPKAVADHLRMESSFKGVLRFEQDTIDEYRKAVEADLKVPKRPSPRRTPEQPFSLPAFG